MAKLERKYKFLVEEMEPSKKLWVLDFEKEKRVKGKTCYYFKLIELQEELDCMLYNRCASGVEFWEEREYGRSFRPPQPRPQGSLAKRL